VGGALELYLRLSLGLPRRPIAGRRRAGRRGGAEQAGQRDGQQGKGPHAILNLVVPARGRGGASDSPDGNPDRSPSIRTSAPGFRA